MTAQIQGSWKVYHKKLRPQFPVKIIEVQDVYGRAIVSWGGFDDSRHFNKRQHLEHARLIAAAPQVARALQDVEWGGLTDAEEGGYVAACPFCGAEKRSGRHNAGCRVAAALAKVGVRS